MALTRREIAARLGRDVAGRRVWIDPALDDEAAVIAHDALRVERPVDAEVAVIRAEAIGENGEIAATGPAFRPAGSRWLAWLDLSGGGRITAGVRGASMGRATRIFSELGVIDVHPGQGLVIVELAPGVSAIDLQAWAEPTLRISPRVDVMVAGEQRG